MIQSMRVRDVQAEALEALSFKLNGKRINLKKMVISESKIAHQLLDLALKHGKVGNDGELYIEEIKGKIK